MKEREETSVRNIKEFPEIDEIKNSLEEISKTNVEEISTEINVEVIFKTCFNGILLDMISLFCMTFVFFLCIKSLFHFYQAQKRKVKKKRRSTSEVEMEKRRSPRLMTPIPKLKNEDTKNPVKNIYHFMFLVFL